MISRATLLLALCAGWAAAGGAVLPGVGGSEVPVLSPPATTTCLPAPAPGRIWALGG